MKSAYLFPEVRGDSDDVISTSAIAAAVTHSILEAVQLARMLVTPL